MVIARQHWMVVCRLTLGDKKRKGVKTEPRIKWQKLTKEDCCAEFIDELRNALGGSEELLDGWEITGEGNC